MKAKLLLCWIVIVSGCKANQEPLDSYLKQLKRDVQVEVSELEPIIDVQISRYTSHNVRQPFELPQAALSVTQQAREKECWQPQSRRKASQLESFSLSQLRLKGVMSRSGKVSALVEAPTGHLVQLAPGQYLGPNHGKVTKVAVDYMLVQEALPDGLGCWHLRDTKLALK